MEMHNIRMKNMTHKKNDMMPHHKIIICTIEMRREQKKSKHTADRTQRR